MPATRRLVLQLSAMLLALPQPRANAADPAVQVVTGELPPFAIEGQPGRPGLLVEVVEQVLRRAGTPFNVTFYPWARAVALPQHQPRTAILPLTRTPEREAHYAWLLKLDTQRFVFINRKDDAPITSLEQARKLRIVLLRGSPNLAQLQRRGFSDANIAQVTRVEDMLRMVDRGMVDALYGGDVINLEKIRSTGRDPARFQVGLLVESADVWLGGSKDFDERELAAWRHAYDAMAKDGTLARLYKAYQVPLPAVSVAQ
jgi:polar amino acid transport system substrate-binding protein